MIKRDVNEFIATVHAVLTALLAVNRGANGTTWAQLRFRCGQLWARGTSTFWGDLAGCFDAARLAGATYADMETVRKAALALAPKSAPSLHLKNAAVQFALAQQANILATTAFTSRQDIDVYFDLINANFGQAEQVAADALDNVAYRSLIALHAAVSDDLANRARPLPRMVSYSFPMRRPSLWMAQRIYCDAARNGELIGENKPVHPLFMPETGKALSA